MIPEHLINHFNFINIHNLLFLNEQWEEKIELYIRNTKHKMGLIEVIGLISSVIMDP